MGAAEVMGTQLLLDLPLREARGRDDFFVSPSNAEAVASLDACETWHDGRCLLIGPTGAGKSHLLAVWASDRGATTVTADSLPAEAPGPLAVDDAHAVAGDRARETALFHLLNGASAARFPVLMAAPWPPRDWSLVLPDLASRLQAAHLARIGTPDDALLTAVIAKQLTDRQLAADAAVPGYVAQRIERSFAAASRAVAALDEAAIRRGRRVTRRLAGEVLRDLGYGAGPE